MSDLKHRVRDIEIELNRIKDMSNRNAGRYNNEMSYLRGEIYQLEERVNTINRTAVNLTVWVTSLQKESREDEFLEECRRFKPETKMSPIDEICAAVAETIRRHHLIVEQTNTRMRVYKKLEIPEFEGECTITTEKEENE